VDLSTVVVVDLIVLCACAGLILTRGGTSHTHPAVLYLLFHALVVTARAQGLANGAPPFLSGLSGYEVVRPEEIVRAVLYADLALIAATVGWVSAKTRMASKGPVMREGNWRPLRTMYVYAVAVVALPLGVLVFALYGFIPGVAKNDSTTSSVTLALTWPGLMLIALIYCRGFKSRFLVPLLLYLGVVALQGYGRFRLIVPLVLLAQIYLDRKGRKWPSLGVAVGLVAAALIFFPLKQIGRSVQTGEDFGNIGSLVQASIGDAVVGRSGDQVLLDELAVSLSLTDQSGKVFLGRPYLNFLVLPIPRVLWENKPGLADYLQEISKPSRPLDKIGAVTTLPGDLYLNFRLPGLILLMFLFARLSARLYEAAYRRPYKSVARFGFLVLSCNLIQIYRDGLISIPFFLLVQMLPLMVILALHIPQPRRTAAAALEATQPPDTVVRRPIARAQDPGPAL